MKMKPLIEKLTENLSAKIICLVVALFIYLFFNIATMSRKTFTVPLLVQASGNFVPASSPLKNVRINVRGKNDQLILLHDKDFEAYLDLDYYTDEGTHLVPIKIQLSALAETMNPLEVQTEPVAVPLKIEPRVIEYVPIAPQFVGSLAEGYQIESYKTAPALVRVSGAESLVKTYGNVITDAVNLANTDKNFTAKTTIINKNSLIQVDAPDFVTVLVTVKEKIGDIVFEDVPVKMIGLRRNLNIASIETPLKVEVSAFENRLKDFQFPENAAVADCSLITGAGTFEIPITVVLGEGFTVKSVSPNKITVKVESQ